MLGGNQFGQLGSSINSGTPNANAIPRDVDTLDSGVVAITAGDNHTCALTSAGAVKCWGNNVYGQLGRVTNLTINPSARDVDTLDSGVVAITAGDNHTCALTSAGAVKCWGSNRRGALGSEINVSTNNANPSPSGVQNLDSGVVAITAAGEHICALTSAGAVKCWGLNLYGQLGSDINSGTNNANPSPLDVDTLDSGVVAIAAGWDHTCALTSAGTVKCWGLNRHGQLGSDINVDTGNANSSPLDADTLDSGVVAITAGGYHTCALTSIGAVKCWGLNQQGQLGRPANSTPNPVPLGVEDLSDIQPAGQSIAFDPPASMPPGASLTLSAIASSGEAVSFDTWTPGTCTITGNTLTATAGALCGVRASQTGSASYAPAPQQLRLIRVGDPTVTQVAGGATHTCALTSAGAVKCWGRNRYGQLGSTTNSGNANANNSPLDVQTLDSGVTAIAGGSFHTCALTNAGAVKCWGLNNYGQLGNPTNSGTTSANNSPLDEQTLDGGVIAIAAGGFHTCALTNAGAVKCWGYNRYGQLGSITNSGAEIANNSPLAVQTLNSGVVAIAAGREHTCGLSNIGALKCWGSNRLGQLGSPTNTSINNSPLDVQTLNNIQPAGQSITFDPPGSMLRSTSLTLSVTASSGEPVSFDTWTPRTCTITGNVLTATAGELCGVRASQTGSSSVAPAPQQLRLIGIQRNDSLTVNVSGQGSVDVSPDPAAGGIDACTEATSPCTANYVNGDAENLDLSATPATGWSVDAWSGDCTVDAVDSSLATVTLDADKTCDISFRINQYIVSFQDWDASVLSTQTVNHGSAATAPANPTRIGYTFSGWSTAFNNITADLTVTAQYTINPYTVSFAVQGGNAVASVTQNYGTTTVLPAATRTGYSFASWNTAANGSGTSYAAGASFTIPANNVTLYAQWTVNTYTVTASVSGSGGTISPATQTVDHDTQASLTITADAGYTVVQPLGGSCATGTLAGNAYTTGTITAACSVVASFTQNPPAAVTLQTGDAQQQPVYADFPQALSVRVTDAGGNPLSGIIVSFTAPSSGASAVLSAPSAITNGNGEASITAEANGLAGSYAVIATAGTASAAFTLENLKIASTLTLSADRQSVAPGGTVTLTAVIGGINPSGSVAFELSDGTVLCASVTISAGTAICQTGPLPARSDYPIIARYAGDGAHEPSSASLFLQANLQPLFIPAGNTWTLALLGALMLLVGGMMQRRR